MRCEGRGRGGGAVVEASRGGAATVVDARPEERVVGARRHRAARDRCAGPPDAEAEQGRGALAACP